MQQFTIRFKQTEMLEYLKEREEAEKDILIAVGGQEFVNSCADWDVVLNEWKIANNVYKLTDTGAKRFLKTTFQQKLGDKTA